MGRYRHLSLEERCELARLQGEGRSIRQIAAAVDRPPSTISRELKRNTASRIGYRADYAEQQIDGPESQGKAARPAEGTGEAEVEREDT